MAGKRASARAFAATWRDSKDEIVATTWGGTMCWFPRKPWRLRIAHEGFEHVIRCRECPGCLEFERRRLADRLHAYFFTRPASHKKYAVDSWDGVKDQAGGGECSTSESRSSGSIGSISAVAAASSTTAPTPGAAGASSTAATDEQLEEAAVLDARSWEKRSRERPGNSVRLFLVRIYAPLARHAELSHKLHRCPSLELERGFARLGTGSFGIIARSKAHVPRALRRLGLEHRIELIKLGRGRRAWRAITAGIAVSRTAYGEQVKRWYFFGLPAAERETWDVIKMGKGSHYQRASSPRAWSHANLVLVPPELWRMRRIDRRQLLAYTAKASSPEAAAFVTSLISHVTQARSMPSPVIASSKPRPSREAMMRQFEHVARVAEVARASEHPNDLTPSPLGGGGYTSSEHSQGELLPEQVTTEGRIGISSAEAELLKASVQHSPATEAEWKQKRLERERRLLNEQLERLRRAMTKGGKSDE